MRGHLGPADVANSIRMTRSQFDGAIVVVEGNGSDSLFYKKVLDRRSARLAPAHGKENLVEVIGRLNGESFAGVLGIADADRDRILGKSVASPNLFLTDTCDLESMLILSPALDKVLLEFGSDSKIQSFEQRRGVTIREFLFESVRPLGALRLISERDGLSLKFKDLRFEKLVTDELGLDLAKLLTTLRTRTPDPPKAKVWQALPSQIEDVERDTKVPSVQLCNGHDLVAMLCLGLRRHWGGSNALRITPDELETLLRVAYESQYFNSTELCASLRVWEFDHPPFRVLGSVS